MTHASAPLEFYASCPEGFEVALTDELRGLGLRQVRQLKGRVTFAGEPVDALRTCLWSRLASRVFAIVGRFDCRDAQDLYSETFDIAWERILRPGSTISVSARGTNDELRNSHFSALCVKDALCDRLAKASGSRPNVDVDNPDARILLTLRGGRASLNLDLSGDPLFKRLPREADRGGSGAPVLRPDYAALLLMQAGWHRLVGAANDAAASPAGNDAAANDAAANENETAAAGPTPVLLDIACASGGVELEAVNMLCDRAPGLLRTRWGFESWTRFAPELWRELVAEAETRERLARAREAVILATDVNGNSVEAARRLLRKAGAARHVTFAPAGSQALADALERQGIVPGVPLAPALVADATTTSLKSMAPLLALAADIRGSEAFSLAPVAILAHDDLMARALGTAPTRTLDVKPNNEDARLFVFEPAMHASTRGGDERSGAAGASGIETAPRTGTIIDLGDGTPCPVLIPESEQFARRLRKVAKQRRKWAQRAGVTCYRVYDADLPDYSAAIDLYEGSPSTPGRWLVIAEYAAPREVDPELAQARLLDILAIAPHIMDVAPDHVFAKARIRSRGGSQYGKGSGGVNAAERSRSQQAGGKKSGSRKQGTRSSAMDATPSDIRTRPLPLIEEGGLTFAVNFNDYLDTGIFLDHRVTRGLVREHARGKRWFLNLFAYTGTATCYAADAGVEETVTVDLSNTYLDWAERNMEQNGFTGREHHFVRADVMSWIYDMQGTNNRWDLIFCDPPTFSNSSKMGERTWDVQRDHVELLVGISHLLTRDGEAIFSCNLRTFRPDLEALAEAGVELTDITPGTIPEDFARNPRIHRCYIVRRV